MPASTLAQLIIALGPSGFGLIEDLAKVWSAPALTLDQVLAITGKARTSYDAYITAAQQAQAVAQPTPTK